MREVCRGGDKLQCGLGRVATINQWEEYGGGEFEPGGVLWGGVAKVSSAAWTMAEEILE